MRGTVGLASIVCLLWGGPASPQRPDLGALDGEWEGSVAVVGGTLDLAGLEIGDEFEIRLEISPDAPKAFAMLSARHELIVRHVARNGPSAIVIGDTLTEHGVETWAFNITKRDASSMLVFVARSIRPPRVGLENARPIAIQATGELRAVGDE